MYVKRWPHVSGLLSEVLGHDFTYLQVCARTPRLGRPRGSLVAGLWDLDEGLGFGLEGPGALG